MENELATTNDVNALANIASIIGGAQPLASNEAFDKLAKSSDYMARLQLCGTSAKLFKKGKIERQHYAYIVDDTNFKDLGMSVDIFPIVWRPKALDMSGDSPVSIYDEKSETFKDTQARSFTKDSECAYGPEFLTWIPSIRSFAGFFLGSKTARGEAGKVRELLGKGCTLTSEIIDGKNGFTWEGIIARPCTTPFALPDPEALKEAINKFTTEAKVKAPEKAVVNTGRAR